MNHYKPEPKLGSAPCSAYIGFRDPKEPLTTSMDNVIASRLGEIALCAGEPKRTDVGDSIDRGLILLRMLNKVGLSLIISPLPAMDKKKATLKPRKTMALSEQIPAPKEP